MRSQQGELVMVQSSERRNGDGARPRVGPDRVDRGERADRGSPSVD